MATTSPLQFFCWPKQESCQTKAIFLGFFEPTQTIGIGDYSTEYNCVRGLADGLHFIRLPIGHREQSRTDGLSPWGNFKIPFNIYLSVLNKNILRSNHERFLEMFLQYLSGSVPRILQRIRYYSVDFIKANIINHQVRALGDPQRFERKLIGSPSQASLPYSDTRETASDNDGDKRNIAGFAIVSFLCFLCATIFLKYGIWNLYYGPCDYRSVPSLCIAAALIAIGFVVFACEIFPA